MCVIFFWLEGGRGGGGEETEEERHGSACLCSHRCICGLRKVFACAKEVHLARSSSMWHSASGEVLVAGLGAKSPDAPEIRDAASYQVRLLVGK